MERRTAQPQPAQGELTLIAIAIAGFTPGDGDERQLAERRLWLSGAFFHCLRLSPMTFIAVIDAWLRLA